MERKNYPAARSRIAAQKQSFLTILAKNGIIEAACQKIGVARQTYYRWRKEDSNFRQLADKAVREGSEVADDVVESQLMKLIQSGDRTATLFYLNHRHPKYSDRAAIRRSVLEKGEEEDGELTPEEEEQINLALKEFSDFQERCRVDPVSIDQ